MVFPVRDILFDIALQPSGASGRPVLGGKALELCHEILARLGYD